MTRDEKKKLIGDWFKNKGLLYGIDPMDDKEIDAFMIVLEKELPELYKMLRENDLVPDRSYEKFMRFVEQQINRSRNNAIFGGFF